MNDLLKNIDGRATQEAIEKVFRQYRTYMLTTEDDLMPTVTTKYTLEMPNFSNVKSSRVEEAAVKMASFAVDYLKFMNWFNRGFNKLNKTERQLITLSYLEEDPLHNYEIYRDMNVSERTFYRMRNKALHKLAISLGVEVYADEKVSAS
ncbi:ArpU family phage packaging/lysis transcriptional regulator [Schinkia sp. CFF1]